MGSTRILPSVWKMEPPGGGKGGERDEREGEGNECTEFPCSCGVPFSAKQSWDATLGGFHWTARTDESSDFPSDPSRKRLRTHEPNAPTPADAGLPSAPPACDPPPDQHPPAKTLSTSIPAQTTLSTLGEPLRSSDTELMRRTEVLCHQYAYLTLSSHCHSASAYPSPFQSPHLSNLCCRLFRCAPASLPEDVLRAFVLWFQVRLYVPLAYQHLNP